MQIYYKTPHKTAVRMWHFLMGDLQTGLTVNGSLFLVHLNTLSTGVLRHRKYGGIANHLQGYAIIQLNLNNVTEKEAAKVILPGEYQR